MSMSRTRQSRSLVSLSLLGLCALSPIASAASLDKVQAGGVLRIGFSEENPGLLERQGSAVKGFAVDLMNLIAKEMKVKTMDWKKVDTREQLLPAVRSGKVDVVFTTLGSLSDVDTTTALTCAGGVLLTRKGGPTSESDLEGRSVAVSAGTPSFYYVRNLPFTKKVNVFRSYDQAFHGFLTGSIDALVMERFDALTMHMKVGPEKYQVSEPLWNEYLYIITPRSDDKSVTAAINVALRKFQRDGTYEKLSKKHFGQDVRCMQ